MESVAKNKSRNHFIEDCEAQTQRHAFPYRHMRIDAGTEREKYFF